MIYDEASDWGMDGDTNWRGNSYVPLNGGSQIKSATDNTGAFDAENPDIRFSLRTADEIDRQDGTQLGEISKLISESAARGNKRGKQQYYKLSKTSEIVKHILTGDYFTIKRSTILDHRGKDYDHSLSDDDWRNISEALHNPLVIAKYAYRTPDGIVHRPANAYSVWVEAIINGHFAMVGVEVKSPSKNITVNSVSTVYGDENITLNDEDVVYSRGNGEGIRTLLGGPKPREYSESPTTPHIIPNSPAAAQVRYSLATQLEEATLDKANESLSRKVNSTVRNIESGIEVKITQTTIRKLVSNAAALKSVENGFTYGQHNAMAANVDTLFAKSRQVVNRPDKAGDANVKSIRRFAAPVSFGDKKAVAWMTVKETKQHGTNLYSVEAIKLEALSRKIEEELAFAPHALNASTAHSIPNSAAGAQVRYSLVTLPSGQPCVVVDREDEIAKINLKDPHSLYEYLMARVGEALDTQFFIGRDLPGEYVYSETSKGYNARMAKAKAKLATSLDEAVKASGNVTIEPAKHKKREGGVYYKAPFAFAVRSGFGNDFAGYDAKILFYTEDGKNLLYDVVEIEDAPDIGADVAKISPTRTTNTGVSRGMPVVSGAKDAALTAAADLSQADRDRLFGGGTRAGEPATPHSIPNSAAGAQVRYSLSVSVNPNRRVQKLMQVSLAVSS